MRYDGNFLELCDADLVLDVSFWKMEEGAHHTYLTRAICVCARQRVHLCQHGLDNGYAQAVPSTLWVDQNGWGQGSARCWPAVGGTGCSMMTVCAISHNVQRDGQDRSLLTIMCRLQRLAVGEARLGGSTCQERTPAPSPTQMLSRHHQRQAQPTARPWDCTSGGHTGEPLDCKARATTIQAITI